MNLKNIKNIIDNIDGFETIIEPFCGSSTTSFNIWLKYPDKKIILNDNHGHLIKVYHFI